jgi:hypothetical protein
MPLVVDRNDRLVRLPPTSAQLDIALRAARAIAEHLGIRTHNESWAPRGASPITIVDPAPCEVALENGELFLAHCENWDHCRLTGHTCAAYRKWVKGAYPMGPTKLIGLLQTYPRDPDDSHVDERRRRADGAFCDEQKLAEAAG